MKHGDMVGGCIKNVFSCEFRVKLVFMVDWTGLGFGGDII